MNYFFPDIYQKSIYKINYDKLKDLQTESNFSDMFNDTESKMYDYYDLSKSKRKNVGKKKNNTKIEVNSLRILDKIINDNA